MDRKEQDDELRPNESADPQTDAVAEKEFDSTAEHWREPLRGTEAEPAAEEIAHGAELAKEQPGYGREGS